MSRLAYDIHAAAEATSVSVELIRKAIAQTDPEAFPPPLEAKRKGYGTKAAYLFTDDALRDWLSRFPQG